MELQQPEEPDGMPAWKVSASAISFSLTLIVIGALFAVGCAAPGQPVTRRPAAPTPITDLSAQQLGNRIELTFTLPKQTVQGRPLRQPPQLEIYREYVSASVAGSANAQVSAPQRLVLTVPSQMVANYREGDLIRLSDHLAAADLSANAGNQAVYMVRTRISKRDSANSNLVAVRILPAPQLISDLQAQVTKSSIELSWTAPAMPEAGALRPISIHYRIYRSSNAVAQGGTPKGTPPASLQENRAAGLPPYVKIAETSSPSYSDAHFTFGETYSYKVSSVAQYESGSVESEYSKILNVTPRDTFPPAAPTGLVASVAPASPSASAQVDLSWAISPETGIAGYNVYRSTAETGPANRWDRLNSSLLLTPVFRDIPVVSGQRYFYRVTAVDRFGNESAPSAPAVVSVPAATE